MYLYFHQHILDRTTVTIRVILVLFKSDCKWYEYIMTDIGKNGCVSDGGGIEQMAFYKEL